MNLDLYCEYARNNGINCCLSELLIECNKHRIIAMIQEELGGDNSSCKCASFDVNYANNSITITIIDSVSLQKVAHVIVDVKYLYDHRIFGYSVKKNTFAYLIYKE